MSEQIKRINNVEICAESFGDPKDPCILMIMGAMASMVWWDSEFCKRLAENKHFVIRYDNRDVGRSTCYEPGQTSYNVLDMADDALGVLDSFNIDKAHLVGMSLGGMICQIIGIRNPERVLTITAISSSVWDDLPELPQIDQKVLDYHASGANLDWSDRESVIKYMVGGWRILNGSKHPFDERRAAILAETELNRANNILCMFNHAMLKGGEELYGHAKEIQVPVLIIHGTEDPVLPFAHAEALHKTVQRSTLLTLEGSGHEMHYEEWNRIIDAIVKHTQNT